MVGLLPFDTAVRLGSVAGRLSRHVQPSKAMALGANLARVRPDATPQDIDRLVADGFASYGRYWVETLRLPGLDAELIDARFSVEGRHHVIASREAGYGPIMVLPHLGGWEWAAAWLTRVDHLGVTAVVEDLQPPDVFDWFAELRATYGIEVVRLGPDAFGPLVDAVRRRQVVCLLGDRDLTGNGVEVDLFGETTVLPTGPALLSRRTGAPLHVTAVYHDGKGYHCHVGPPLWPDTSKPLRAALADTTQQIADGFAELISRAPEQWHVLEPLWD